MPDKLPMVRFDKVPRMAEDVFTEPPDDGETYGRSYKQWIQLDLTNPPFDAIYGRRGDQWVELAVGTDFGDMLKSTYDTNDDGVVNEADFAALANHANLATRAIDADTAGYADNAGNALEADHASRADNALFADEAVIASKAIGLPVDVDDIVNKEYVDLLVAATQGLTYLVGLMDASANIVKYLPRTGLPDGPLIDPDASNAGWYVIVETAGEVLDPDLGPVVTGDWIASTGVEWVVLHFGSGGSSAASVVVSPPRFSANNVQASLTNAEIEVNRRVTLDTAQDIPGRKIFSGGGVGVLAPLTIQKPCFSGLANQQSIEIVHSEPDGTVTDIAGAVAIALVNKNNAANGGTKAALIRLIPTTQTALTATPMRIAFSQENVGLHIDIIAASFWVPTWDEGLKLVDGTSFCGFYLRDTGRCPTIRKSSTYNRQPQIEEGNGTNPRDILDWTNGVTVGNTASHPGIPNDGYQNIRGIKRFLNLVQFAAMEVVDDASNITTLRGILLSENSRIWVDRVTRTLILQEAGNVQPQISNSDGANRRDIIDTVNGDIRYVRTIALQEFVQQNNEAIKVIEDRLDLIEQRLTVLEAGITPPPSKHYGFTR
ncbi:MAG TPA: hypothetical protein VNZ45_01660 [Bacteroidia bacterium]|jgi:hypothetical protein|nr:hypothetical protein [Bacteroidia bacterium]